MSFFDLTWQWGVLVLPLAIAGLVYEYQLLSNTYLSEYDIT